MMPLEELLHSRCKPQTGAAMTTADAQKQLQVLPQWSLVGDAIERRFAFANYFETLAFVNALAYIVHHEDHHPVLTVEYNRCTIRFNTHSVHGLSLNDFICAAKVDALDEQRFG